jgi:hypothetical protein
MGTIDPGRGALGIIFAFFLGLMVTAFVGVGVYTFYPPQDLATEMEALNRRDVAVRDMRAPTELTEAERDELRTLNGQREALADATREAREGWGRVTSIVLITVATLVMGASLATGLPVLANGLLLGGLFTMVYGVGWIVTTDTSVVRFVVMTVALGLTLGLGYVRFVRPPVAPAVVGHPAPAGGWSLDLERRVEALEARLHDAASALARGGHDKAS